MGRARGFTLIELLVVVTITSVLIGLSLVTLKGVRKAADRTGGVYKMREIGLAVLQYAQDNNDYLPGPMKAGQGVLYHPSTRDQLATVLGPYLGVTQENQAQVLKIFIPPAYAREMSALDPTKYRPFVVNLNATSAGRKFYPWEGSTSTKPGRISSCANVWGFADADQSNPLVAGESWAAFTPPRPVHGSTRLAWFFNGSVQQIDEATLLASTFSANGSATNSSPGGSGGSAGSISLPSSTGSREGIIGDGTLSR